MSSFNIRAALIMKLIIFPVHLSLCKTKMKQMSYTNKKRKTEIQKSCSRFR